MSLDEDRRRAARRDPSSSEAAKLEARAGGKALVHRTMDGQKLHLHQMSDEHLRNKVKMDVRRFILRLVEDGAIIRSPLANPVSIGNFLEDFGKKEAPYLEECRRRNFEPGWWLDYFRAVREGRCDECGKRKRWREGHPLGLTGSSVTPRGPTERLQCQACAKGFELRCSRCGGREHAEGEALVKALGIFAPASRWYFCATPECLEVRTYLAWMPKKKEGEA